MLRSFGYDWKKSKAHWLLLSKLIHTQDIDNVDSDFWKSVLGELPNQAIKRFVNEGFVALADLENLLAYKHNITELKVMLKQRGLPVSGRKDDMIKRLVTADPAGMKKSTAGLTIYICTPKGRELAEQYLLDEKEKRNFVEKQVMEYLQKRMFKEASIAVATYEAEQVSSRGIGIDWKHHDSSRDVDILTTIYNGMPKILKGLANDKFEPLRLGAAMMFLWGKGTAMEWLPPNFETGIRFDTDTAVRMFVFYAINKANLVQYRNYGVAKYIKILTAEDSCEACKKLGNKKYKINEFPELPYEHCIHKMGCRCIDSPVVMGFE